MRTCCNQDTLQVGLAHYNKWSTSIVFRDRASFLLESFQQDLIQAPQIAVVFEAKLYFLQSHQSHNFVANRQVAGSKHYYKLHKVLTATVWFNSDRFVSQPDLDKTPNAQELITAIINFALKLSVAKNLTNGRMSESGSHLNWLQSRRDDDLLCMGCL